MSGSAMSTLAIWCRVVQSCDVQFRIFSAPLPTDVTGRQRLAIYGGARPWSALNVSRHNLNWTVDALWYAKPLKAIPQHVLDVVVGTSGPKAHMKLCHAQRKSTTIFH